MKPRNHAAKLELRRVRARARAAGATQPEADPIVTDTRFRIGAAARIRHGDAERFAALDYAAEELRVAAGIDACSCHGCPTRGHSNDDCPVRAIQVRPW